MSFKAGPIKGGSSNELVRGTIRGFREPDWSLGGLVTGSAPSDLSPVQAGRLTAIGSLRQSPT